MRIFIIKNVSYFFIIWMNVNMRMCLIVTGIIIGNIKDVLK